jgi:hypothetical protein
MQAQNVKNTRLFVRNLPEVASRASVAGLFGKPEISDTHGKIPHSSSIVLSTLFGM